MQKKEGCHVRISNLVRNLTYRIQMIERKFANGALHSMFPLATVLEFGGAFPWEADPNKALVACPDPHRVVVFELRREEKPDE